MMKGTSFGLGTSLLGLFTIAAMSTVSQATIPYAGAGGPFPGFGPGLGTPVSVGGKEYSHDFDSSTIGAILPPPPFDPQQIVAWDGLGGTVDVTDYTGTRPSYTPEDQMDAIANRGDFAYKEVKTEIAHLVFSVDDTSFAYPGGLGGPAVPSALPAAGPILTPVGPIGGAGEISFELGTAFGALPSSVGTWATQGMINGMPLPDDIDGTEVWGPEPPGADADKYSLDMDIFSGTSVWNGSGTPYISHAAIVGAVTSLLGTVVEFDDINLDALMVRDVVGDPDRFDDDLGGAGLGDEIIFSIRQIPSALDPTGYYATGSELFVLPAFGPASFLAHGGHLWDKGYALGAFDVGAPGAPHVLDVNAIEAIGEFSIPEPASITCLLLGLTTCLVRRSKH
jgi:hypothetical protein